MKRPTPKSVPLYRGMIRGICLSEHWPEPVFEWRVCSTRRWRYDCAWPTHKVALEVQGGVWLKRGGHTGGQAQIDDFEKINTAQILGWVVLQVTPQQVASGELTELLRRAFGGKIAERSSASNT